MRYPNVGGVVNGHFETDYIIGYYSHSSCLVRLGSQNSCWLDLVLKIRAKSKTVCFHGTITYNINNMLNAVEHGYSKIYWLHNER